MKIDETLDDWLAMKLSWRVGILSPARHKVFSALNLDPSGQPPPGLTTPLPHHWEKGLDDGTGMGEDAPMERHDVPGGVFSSSDAHNEFQFTDRSRTRWR